MKKWLFAILIGSALVLGACGGDNNDNDTGGDNNSVETSAADEVYEKSCMKCHGGNLDDGSAPADLTAIGSKYSAEEIEEIIENGTGGMPPITNISDDDRTLLADWLADKK